MFSSPQSSNDNINTYRKLIEDSNRKGIVEPIAVLKELLNYYYQPKPGQMASKEIVCEHSHKVLCEQIKGMHQIRDIIGAINESGILEPARTTFGVKGNLKDLLCAYFAAYQHLYHYLDISIQHGLAADKIFTENRAVMLQNLLEKLLPNEKHNFGFKFIDNDPELNLRVKTLPKQMQILFKAMISKLINYDDEDEDYDPEQKLNMLKKTILDVTTPPLPATMDAMRQKIFNSLASQIIDETDKYEKILSTAANKKEDFDFSDDDDEEFPSGLGNAASLFSHFIEVIEVDPKIPSLDLSPILPLLSSTSPEVRYHTAEHLHSLLDKCVDEINLRQIVRLLLRHDLDARHRFDTNHNSDVLKFYNKYVGYVADDNELLTEISEHFFALGKEYAKQYPCVYIILSQIAHFTNDNELKKRIVATIYSHIQEKPRHKNQPLFVREAEIDALTNLISLLHADKKLQSQVIEASISAINTFLRFEDLSFTTVLSRILINKTDEMSVLKKMVAQTQQQILRYQKPFCNNLLETIKELNDEDQSAIIEYMISLLGTLCSESMCYFLGELAKDPAQINRAIAKINQTILNEKDEASIPYLKMAALGARIHWLRCLPEKEAKEAANVILNELKRLANDLPGKNIQSLFINLLPYTDNYVDVKIGIELTNFDKDDHAITRAIRSQYFAKLIPFAPDEVEKTSLINTIIAEWPTESQTPFTSPETTLSLILNAIKHDKSLQNTFISSIPDMLNLQPGINGYPFRRAFVSAISEFAKLIESPVTQLSLIEKILAWAASPNEDVSAMALEMLSKICLENKYLHLMPLVMSVIDEKVKNDALSIQAMGAARTLYENYTENIEIIKTLIPNLPTPDVNQLIMGYLR